jgi:hypothetical protein
MRENDPACRTPCRPTPAEPSRSSCRRERAAAGQRRAPACRDRAGSPEIGRTGHVFNVYSRAALAGGPLGTREWLAISSGQGRLGRALSQLHLARKLPRLDAVWAAAVPAGPCVRGGESAASQCCRKSTGCHKRRTASNRPVRRDAFKLCFRSMPALKSTGRATRLLPGCNIRVFATQHARKLALNRWGERP